MEVSQRVFGLETKTVGLTLARVVVIYKGA